MDKTIVMPLFLTGEAPEQTLPSNKLVELTEVTATLIKHAATYRKHGPNRPRSPQEMKLIAKMFKQTIDSWYAEEVEE
ncbi:hypothetical protein [Aneurinibacillus terranovensis]|uniref:hypothetical protein n=1 Tax=Aneurinibacillus terranovensis TaxID=278991 RepID=UPI00041257A9|nr:hypothetical protein [Aneurinibacillus terranovensis]